MGQITQPRSAGGGGTVTTVSVTTAGGFQGTVATPGTTPAISLQLSGTDKRVVFNDGNNAGSVATFTYNKGTDTLLAANVTNAPGSVTFGQLQVWHIFPTLGGSNTVTWDDFNYEFTGFSFVMRLTSGADGANTGYRLTDDLSSIRGGYSLSSSNTTVNPEFNNVPNGQSINYWTLNSRPAYFGVHGSAASYGFDVNSNFLLFMPLANLSKLVTVEVAGFTRTLTKRTTAINPAGVLATGTINLPATPIDGQEAFVSTTQTITALTVSGNGNTIKNAPTTLQGGTGFGYFFDNASATWFRLY